MNPAPKTTLTGFGFGMVAVDYVAGMIDSLYLLVKSLESCDVEVSVLALTAYICFYDN
jgi:hypothetical protein